MTTPTWITALIDTPAEQADAAERFWAAVSGTTLGPATGDHGEFASLQPATGTACLAVQREQEASPGGLHVDLHHPDTDALAARANDLGATLRHVEPGFHTGRSPAGLPFCVIAEATDRPPGPVAWPSGRSEVDQVCLDVPPDRFRAEVDFWTALTGWEHRPLPDDPEFERLLRPQGQPLALLLQRLDDEQDAATAHLDLSADDRDAEVARHAALGATVLGRHPHWTLLADPVGRRYCVTHRRPWDA